MTNHDAVGRGANEAGYFGYAKRIGKPLSSLGQDARGRARRALGGRQFDEEPRAAVEVVRLRRRERDRPAVSRHQVRRDREAEARAGLARRLVERLENPLALIGRESGTGVADFNQRQPIGANRRKANGFRTSVRRRPWRSAPERRCG